MFENASLKGSEMELRRFLIFSVEGKLYAFESSVIAEVIGDETVYPLPLTPKCVKGLINRFSLAYLLIDTAYALLGKTAQYGKILIFKEAIDKLAFTIDDCVDIVDVAQEEISAIGEEHGVCISGMFYHKGQQVFTLDEQTLIEQIGAELAL
ncbi:MAG: chemotaxis protein CheW [Helicobacteraceae bacterium]|jgi:purine-binding chemotaxis protein CheW|nr:chemotaxis protein CheW [Helicobacteraceae bacterium]